MPIADRPTHRIRQHGRRQTIELPFATFERYRSVIGLHTDRLRRIGIVAIGRDFEADLCVHRLALYRKIE